jgi:hypothetical protein
MARHGRHRVIAARHQHVVTIAWGNGLIQAPVGRVDPLQVKARGRPDLVGAAGLPSVAAGRVHLNQDEPGSRCNRQEQVVDVTIALLLTTVFGQDLFRSDQLRLGRGRGRRTGHGQMELGYRLQMVRTAGQKEEHVGREAIPHIPTPADVLEGAVTGRDRAPAARHDQSSFVAAYLPFKHGPTWEALGGEVHLHLLPAGFSRRERREFSVQSRHRPLPSQKRHNPS